MSNYPYGKLDIWDKIAIWTVLIGASVLIYCAFYHLLKPIIGG